MTTLHDDDVLSQEDLETYYINKDPLFITEQDAWHLKAQAAHHLEKGIEILRKASNEGRALKADEQRQIDKHDHLAKRINDVVTLSWGGRKREILGGEARRSFESAHAAGGPSSHRGGIGESLRAAVSEVREGRAVAYVDLPAESRAIEEGGPAGGAVPVFIQNPVTTLRAKSVVMGLPGIRIVNMRSDRERFPRIGANTVVGVGEDVALTEDTADVDLVDLVAQKFGVIEYMSTEFEEDASFDALQVFGENLVEALGRRVDYGFLEGLGNNDLVGIRNTPSANTTSVAGTPADFDKFSTALYEALADNADPSVWVMHPRTWKTAQQIKTGITSDKTTLLEPNPQQGPKTLLGLPVEFSTQITLTEGTNGSWVAALDTSQLVIGIRRPARLEVSRDFRFDRDQIAVRCTGRYAFAALNPEGISLLTDVRA
jgi:HK97 family phage major capsid protein